MFTYVQSLMSMKYIMDQDIDLHDTGHHFSPAEPWMAQGIAWHIRHWAYLLDKMRATPDGDGTLLDHSVVLFLTEGGFGTNPETKGRSANSSENMIVRSIGHSSCICPCVKRGKTRETSDNNGEFNGSAHQADEMVGAKNDETTNSKMGANRTQTIVGTLVPR